MKCVVLVVLQSATSAFENSNIVDDYLNAMVNVHFEKTCFTILNLNLLLDRLMG
jgi:hypothetical protein